jgi:hypothetical protein
MQFYCHTAANLMRHKCRDVSLLTYGNNTTGSVHSFRTCELLTGDLPKRQARLVLAWTELHQEELMANWKLVMNGEDPFKVPPLQ